MLSEWSDRDRDRLALRPAPSATDDPPPQIVGVDEVGAPPEIPVIERPPPPPAVPVDGRGPIWSIAALLDPTALAPSAGVWLGVDVPFGSGPAFGRLSVSHEQTMHPDRNGIAQQTEALAVGAGLRFPMGHGWAVRFPLQLDVEHLRVSIHQPMTGRNDAGSRFLVGAAFGADLAWSIDSHFSLFAGALASVVQDSTTVRVGRASVLTISPFSSAIAAGLNVRVP
jgi:hypothetical protein